MAPVSFSLRASSSSNRKPASTKRGSVRGASLCCARFLPEESRQSNFKIKAEMREGCGAPNTISLERNHVERSFKRFSLARQKPLSG
jgi:hypothetical protein